MSATFTWVGRASLVGMAAFAIYYPYKLLTQFVPFSFSGPEPWAAHWIVEDTVVAPLWLRASHFGLWVPTILGTLVMVLSAIYLVILLLRQSFFELSTVRALQRVGLWAAIAGFSALVAVAFEPWLMTLLNSENTRSPRIHLESGEMGVMLTGLGLVLLAHVLKLAVMKDRENKEII